MKIAIVMAHGGVHNRKGGAHNVFFAMANHFARRHEVLAVYDDARIGKPLYSVSKTVNLLNLSLPVEFSGYKIVKLKREIIRGVARALSSAVHYNAVTKKRQELVADALIEPLSEFKPDICIAFNISDLRSLALCQRSSIAFPIITMCHTDTNRVYNRLASYEKHVLSASDVFQVLLDEYKTSIQKLTSTKIVSIGNIIPQVEQVSSCEAQRIIYMGRLEKNKRQHLLIEAIAKLPRRHLDGWTVSLYGSPTDRKYTQYLHELINRYHLKGIVRFEGETNEPMKELKSSAICCFPSALEGFSLALGEAMATGLPCVAFSDCPGLKSLINHGENGYLESDVDGFSIRLQSLILNKDLRKAIGKEAQRSMSKFTESEIWAQWDSLITETIASQK